MKRIFLVKLTTLVIASITLCGGCTKDSLTPQPDTAPTGLEKKFMGKAPNFGGMYMDEQNYGALTGTILPATVAARVYLSGDASMELVVDTTGTISSQEIPVGEYTVDIIPDDYYYYAYTISNVFVYADSITNLGTIHLEYAGSGGGGCEIGWGRSKKSN